MIEYNLLSVLHTVWIVNKIVLDEAYLPEMRATWASIYSIKQVIHISHSLINCSYYIRYEQIITPDLNLSMWLTFITSLWLSIFLKFNQLRIISIKAKYAHLAPLIGVVKENLW